MIRDFEIEVERLDRHLTILRLIIGQEPIGIARLSDETGVPQHKVRYSLRLLENEDLIEPTSEGAVTTEETGAFLENHRGKINEIIDRINQMRLDLD